MKTKYGPENSSPEEVLKNVSHCISCSIDRNYTFNTVTINGDLNKHLNEGDFVGKTVTEVYPISGTFLANAINKCIITETYQKIFLPSQNCNVEMTICYKQYETDENGAYIGRNVNGELRPEILGVWAVFTPA